MNTTLAVVVSAIVILITALVVITIFSGGMGQIGTFSQAKTICASQAAASCAMNCQMPITWSATNMRVGEAGTAPVACSATNVEGGKTCGSYVPSCNSGTNTGLNTD
jgi:hypothetical protein